MVNKPVPFFFDLSKEVVIELSDDMSFGRNSECDYSVVDHRVSGEHFKVLVKDTEVYIIDLESSNNTKLNGEILTPNSEMKLSIRDKVNFGEQIFYYFYENIENFMIPEITRTLTISSAADSVDEMMMSSGDYDVENLSLGCLDNKKTSQLSDLKKSKALVTQYEKSLKLVLTEIEKKNTVHLEYDNLMKKIMHSRDELKSSGYEDRLKITEDTKNFTSSIDTLLKSISEAEANIISWKNEILCTKVKIEEIKRVELIHECLAEDQKVENKLSKQVEEFREKALEEKREELQKKIKAEFENYKNIQEEYSDRLKYMKNRMIS